jgi:hypothetical protein
MAKREVYHSSPSKDGWRVTKGVAARKLLQIANASATKVWPRLFLRGVAVPRVAGGRGDADDLDRDAAGFRASSPARPEPLTGLGSVASGQ